MDTISRTIEAPPVQRLISRFETKTKLAFKPRRDFFKSVGINPHRFALFIRGQKHPDSEEIKELVQFFNQFFLVNVEDLL